MSVLCSMFKPHSGLITNIGLEHLEGFKDIEAVAKEESEVYLMAQRDDAMAFVNEDDPWLQNMSKRLAYKHTYSTVNPTSDVYVKILSEMPYLDMEIFVKAESIGTVSSKLGENTMLKILPRQ